MVNMELINESGHICFTGLSKLSQMHVMADLTVSELTMQLDWKNEIGGSPDGCTIDNSSDINRDVITQPGIQGRFRIGSGYARLTSNVEQ